MRANLARRPCGASRDASPTPSSRASWWIRRCLRAAQLDKEEPRTPLWRSSRKASSTKFGPNVVTSHVPDPTPDDERCCLPRLFWQALTDPWHQRAQRPGTAILQALSVSPGDDPEPLALVRLLPLHRLGRR